MRLTPYKIQIFLVLLASILSCNCTEAVHPYLPAPKPVVPTKSIQTPYTLPTAEYLALAHEQGGELQQNAYLSAAGRMVHDGQLQQAQAILTQTHDLTVGQNNEKQLLLAKIDSMRNNSKGALLKLAQIQAPALMSAYHQLQWHELLARSYKAEGNVLDALIERVRLDPLLAGERDKHANRKKLWFALIRIPLEELETLSAETSADSELQGWLQLALIAKKYRNNSKALLAAVETWQVQFSSHPANSLLPNPIGGIVDRIHEQPKKIALLLPLSGSLAGPGAAIRDGFMAAKASHSENAVSVRFYDTNQGAIETTYQKALADGAEYVIGPLTKNQVTALAAMNSSIPTLFLNDTEHPLSNNVYTLALSPSDEATQVAIKARNTGYKKALIIAPKNDWGLEVSRAFSRQFKKQGGVVVDTFSYGPNEDLNRGIKALLGIDDSQQREKELKNVLGHDLRVVMSRRQDIDTIFLLAYPSKARQIMPLLKYYYAGDIPVFATSSVYTATANPLKDKDLNGIVFCDMPWVFSHQLGSRNWPEPFNSYNRLYALGVDSYALATQLNQLILFSADEGEPAGGTLYLKPSQRIARVLEWGQFKQGLVHSLGDS